MLFAAITLSRSTSLATETLSTALASASSVMSRRHIAKRMDAGAEPVIIFEKPDLLPRAPRECRFWRSLRECLLHARPKSAGTHFEPNFIVKDRALNLSIITAAAVSAR